MAMCFLRKRIEETLRGENDPQKAALAVCLLLENEVGLCGNGWFDGDADLLDAIRAE